MTVRLHEEPAPVTPFGAPDQKTDFTPGRVRVEKLDGQVTARPLETVGDETSSQRVNPQLPRSASPIGRGALTGHWARLHDPDRQTARLAGLNPHVHPWPTLHVPKYAPQAGRDRVRRAGRRRPGASGHW
jgi:hypothetical protein